MPRLLVGCLLASCAGSQAEVTTCFNFTESYRGTAGGAAYLRYAADDGSSFSGFESAQSISLMIAINATSDSCYISNDPDFLVTATAWIDVSGSESAACDGPESDSLCRPSAGDPQGTVKGTIRRGQSNSINVTIVDRP